ncbi:mastermind-like domain-containing protein 1 isoform X2 [Hemicordylus capensis]|uniref:mastermind-like domain-containing protein 1 isoform X2 n=1 Tax=Hemicordylus capensis TaxID=884348 RepID=UPI0023041F75|nr:mastermind-like domain-containing protein 1 isoform X2 [Hemicordylus capensis]
MLLVSPRVEAPRMEPHIPLQGSIKRKVEDDSSSASNTMPDVIFPSDSKRLCLDDVTLSMGQGANPVSCPDMQHSPFSTNHSASSMGVTGHGMLLENNHMNGSSIGSPFSVPPNAEVGQKGPIGGQNSMGHYEEKGSNIQSVHIPSVDQELQDLLEELTKMPDPSPNELDLEKILGSKTEESLGSLGHSQPPINNTPKSSPQTPHLDNHVPSKDFSPGCIPTSGGSPQMRPSSAGASYPVPSQNKPVASPISSTVPSKSQAQSMLPVSLPSMTGSNWHAQQLKHLAAASKQVPTTKHQGPSWPTISSQGLSPPYRQGSSPHHQPFSPQNVMVSSMSSNGLPGSNIQSPQNPLLSSITSNSNPSSGPSPPFGSEKLSSPVLNQQPFSPPNPILSNISATSIPTSSIKSPQSNLVSTNTGPSPPYRPEKLSSPALHQQPFSPQSTLIPNITPTSNPSNMQSPLFKSMSATQSKNMNMIIHPSSNGLQPGLVTEGPVAQDQFSFNNTKPLSHFTSESTTPQKMSPMPSGPGQQSLIHYLQQQQQQQQQQVATSQQSQQVSSQYLQQQLRHLMQPSRMQRHVQPTPLLSQARQDQPPGIVARLQEPGAAPPAGSVPAPAPTMVNGYTMRNHLLKQQIIRRQQQLQEKQRHSMLGVASEQRSFVGQQMNQFPVSQTMPTDCSQPMQTPPRNHRMMPSPQGILQNTLASGIAPAAVNQNSGAMVMMPHNSGKQPGMFPPNSDFNLPLRPSQSSLGINSGCQTVHSHPAARPGMALSGFTAGSLVNHSSAQQHLRQPALPAMPNIYSNASAQMWTQTGVPRMPNQTPMDTSMQQQFASNPLFSKQNTRPNIPGQPFSHQAVVPPNRIAPGVQARQMQKVSLGQPGQSLGTLNNQNLRHNLTRGPLPAAMNVMKPMPQGVSSFNQLGSAQAVGPPSYPGSTGQPSGTFNRMNTASELPPQYNYVTQQNNSVLPGNCNEADFIDSLMKSGGGSTDEDWLNNLTMIDDILGQHVQSSGHV